MQLNISQGILTCSFKSTCVLFSYANYCSQGKSLRNGSQATFPDGAPIPNDARSNWDFISGRPHVCWRDTTLSTYPYNVIYEYCKVVHFPPYQHHSNNQLEILANKNSWEEIQHLMPTKIGPSSDKKEIKKENKFKLPSNVALELGNSE